MAWKNWARKAADKQQTEKSGLASDHAFVSLLGGGYFVKIIKESNKPAQRKDIQAQKSVYLGRTRHYSGRGFSEAVEIEPGRKTFRSCWLRHHLTCLYGDYIARAQRRRQKLTTDLQHTSCDSPVVTINLKDIFSENYCNLLLQFVSEKPAYIK